MECKHTVHSKKNVGGEKVFRHDMSNQHFFFILNPFKRHFQQIQMLMCPKKKKNCLSEVKFICVFNNVFIW